MDTVNTKGKETGTVKKRSALRPTPRKASARTKAAPTPGNGNGNGNGKLTPIASSASAPVKRVSPHDIVRRMGDLERERIGRLDAEIRNALQGINLAAKSLDILARDETILMFEHQTIRQQLEKQLQDHAKQTETKIQDLGVQAVALNAEIKTLENMIAAKRGTYESEMQKLAERHNVDVNLMTFDPDTGIIRTLPAKPLN
jgi:hypothetical protein